MGEIIFIAAVTLLVVGTDDLPYVMRWIGRRYAELRRTADELRRSLVLEADRMDAEDRLKDLKARRARDEADRARAREAGGVPQDLRLAGTDLATSDASPVDVSPASLDSDIPQGFSAEDWAELPPATRAALLAASPATPAAASETEP